MKTTMAIENKPVTAPAAHTVSIRPDGVGGGVLVGHTLCDAPEVFVPNMPDQRYVLSIDVVQAVLNHKCVNSRETDPT